MVQSFILVDILMSSILIFNFYKIPSFFIIFQLIIQMLITFLYPKLSIENLQIINQNQQKEINFCLNLKENTSIYLSSQKKDQFALHIHINKSHRYSSMKFNITIREQNEAVNGKAKNPLYKASNEKHCDEDKGLETLNQLLDNSSIKIFCYDCQKQITLQTIVITYETHKKSTENTTNRQVNTKKQEEKPNQKNIQTERLKNTQPSAIKKLLKPLPNRKRLQQKYQEELFEDQQQESQANSSSYDVVNLQQQEDDSIQQIEINQKNTKQKPKSQQKTDSLPSEQLGTVITHLYCVGCFASLEEFPESYSVRKSLKFSPKNSEWRFFDEICLLNGLKQWGFGNWGEIKQFMDYNSCIFQVHQIEEHYEEVYLNNQCLVFDPLQNFDIATASKPKKKTWSQAMHDYYYPAESSQNISIKRQRPIQDHSVDKKPDLIKKSSRGSNLQALKHPKNQKSSFNTGSLKPNTSPFGKDKNNKKNDECLDEQQYFEDSQSQEDMNFSNNLSQIQLKPKSSSKLPQLRSYASGKCLKQNSVHANFHQTNNQTKPQCQSLSLVQKPQNTYSNPLLKGHNVYSYNPKRKQFQILQYDHDAQMMLVQLQFSQDDSQQQIQLKLKIIQEYNRRLDERIKRREFVIQHRLLDTEFMVNTIRKYNKNYGRKFEPFRRLIKKNQHFYDLVDCYNRTCNIKALTDGIVKVKRKLGATKKNLKFKDITEYLTRKKQKKQLLGQRMKSQSQRQRIIYFKQSLKGSKKVILSMSENTSSYANISNNNLNSSNAIVGNRTMTSRSQQRERARNNLTLNRQTNTDRDQSQNNQKFKNNSNQSNAQNSLSGMSSNSHHTSTEKQGVNNSKTGLVNILANEQVQSIQKQLKRYLEDKKHKGDSLNQLMRGKQNSPCKKGTLVSPFLQFSGNLMQLKNYRINFLQSYIDQS